LFIFLASLAGISYAYRQQQSRGVQKGSTQIVNSPTHNILTTEYAIIPVKSFNDRKNTKITIPFIPPKGQLEVWLSLRLNDEKKMHFLMSHADLNQLDWDYVSNNNLTLFQKNKSYDSIDDFIQNIPVDSAIQADESLIEKYFQGYENAKPLDKKLDKNTVDYILTSYRPFYFKNKWSVFETTIDATDAFIDKDTLFMEFNIQGISEENPLAFEQIYVDY